MAKIDVVYVEEAVASHPRVNEILARVRPRHVVVCVFVLCYYGSSEHESF